MDRTEGLSAREDGVAAPRSATSYPLPSDYRLPAPPQFARPTPEAVVHQAAAADGGGGRRREVRNALTQTAEVLACLLRRLEARDEPAHVRPVTSHPWERLAPPPSADDVDLPADNIVYWKAWHLCGQHKARFALQMVSMWPKLDYEERKAVYNHLDSCTAPHYTPQGDLQAANRRGYEIRRRDKRRGRSRSWSRSLSRSRMISHSRIRRSAERERQKQYKLVTRTLLSAFDSDS